MEGETQKIMEKLADIHTDVAVLKSRFDAVGKLESRVGKVETKLSFHDKVVGAVVLTSGIILTLIKYGKI